ncbi:SMP-30/gluconolactonase/LRE family protein [Nonomuraea sp. NPDC049400]|uniref:SMP-30/gluconolactonase/LRE family protein n=1 Tax=Nonomuraea sp. NPDC049400 TaxID=3364352 RepID=UPI003797B671
MANSKILNTFDHSAGELAENVVVLADGTICATLLLAGAVWLSSGEQEQVVADHADAIVVGLASDADDRLYAAVRSTSDTVAGIWRREAPHRWIRFAAAEPRAGLNGITFTEDGTLFAADSVHGEILCCPPGDDTLRLWLADERLTPTSPDDPVSSTGVNGLKVWDGDLWATNTAQGTVLRIGIDDGRAGELTRVHTGIPADDFAFDSAGTLYLAVHPRDTVLRITPDGAMTVLATEADGLDGPTAIAVIDDGLVVTSLGMLGSRHEPNIVRLTLDVAGPALPRPRMPR